MARPRVLLDCDPGHDDALAILLASVHADVVGITTVSGNAPLEATTRNALAVVQMLGADIEVHAGSPRPLLGSTGRAPAGHGRSGLDGPLLPPLTRAATGSDAVGFLLESSRRHEGLWVVATGPLTNVALALRSDPGLAARLGGISVMGGSATAGNVTAVAEFNTWCDPEAAAIVFEAGCPVLMSGLDLTSSVLIRPPVVARIRSLQAPVATFVADLFDFLLDRNADDQLGQRRAPLHDPCALVVLTHPTLFERTARPIAVETTGRLTRGMTVVDRRTRTRNGADPAGGHLPVTEWVHGVDVDAFFELVVDSVSRICED